MNMKKTGRKVAALLTMALLMFALSFTGCSHGSELETYEVTFESNGGSSVQAQTVVEDSLVAEPKDPAKDGFTFGGWFTDAECTTAFDFTAKIEEDLTLYAKWNEVEKAEDKPEEEQKEEEKKEEEKSAEVNKEVNVVSFETAGGTAIPAQKLEKGSKASKPKDPEKEGYTFGGWLLDDKEFDFNLVVPSNITLFAKWTKNVYTVTFDLVLPPESTETKNPTQKVAFEDKATLPAKPTRKDGFTFAGWYTDPSYNNNYKFDVNTPITEDTTVYAAWNAPSGKYIVRFITRTYNEKGVVSSTEVTSQIVDSGNLVEEPAAAEKTGYTFDGWYTDSGYASYNKYNFDNTVTSGKTLYARWRKNPGAKLVVKTIAPELELKDNSDYTITIHETNGYYGSWYVDNQWVSSDSSSYTFNPEQYGKGSHVVMFKYSYGSNDYNANLVFEIQ